MLNVGRAKIAKLLPQWLITTSGFRNGKTIYLTFDDGPHPEYTGRLLELLKKYSIKATFFCIGDNIDRYPEIVNSIVQSEHLIANHSQTHRSFRFQSLSSKINEINECQSRILTINPQAAKIFRAPGGQLSIDLLIKLIFSKWKIIHWSYDSLDYKSMAIEDQIKNFNKNEITAGDILLFHDDNELTIRLLEQLIPQWIEHGYQFNRVDELISS